jgi:hypothetical protein
MTRDRELADRMSQRITSITSSTATPAATGAGEGHGVTAADGDV